MLELEDHRAGHQEEKRRHKIQVREYNLEPTRTGPNWNLYQLQQPRTLIMWASGPEEARALCHRTKYTGGPRVRELQGRSQGRWLLPRARELCQQIATMCVSVSSTSSCLNSPSWHTKWLLFHFQPPNPLWMGLLWSPQPAAFREGISRKGNSM